MVCCSNNNKNTYTRNPRREELLFLQVNAVLHNRNWNLFVHAQSNLGKFKHGERCPLFCVFISHVRRCDGGVLVNLLYLCLFARSEHRPSTKERHCFLSVAIFSISFQVYPISFVSFSVSLCQVFRGLPLLLFPGGFHVMA